MRTPDGQKLSKLIRMTFKYFIIINCLLYSSLIGDAQPFTIQWQKCLGGTLGDAGYSIIQTPDGGYLSGGIAISNDGDVSGNHGNHIDYWVTKINGYGNLIWQKCYGGSGEDYLYSLLLDSDGGFIIAGIGGSNDGDIIGMHTPGDYWIVKCDSVGGIQWQRCMGGSGSENAYRIIRSIDKGSLVVGYANSSDFDVTDRHDSSLCPTCADAWLIKLDSGGAISWAKCYGGYLSESGYAVIQTSDSGFLFVASARSDNGDVHGLHAAIPGVGGLSDYWVVKIDASGIIQWQKCYGGSEDESPNDVIQTNDGGYIITGSTYSEDYDVIGHHGVTDFRDAWLIKLDSLGNMQWQSALVDLTTILVKKFSS
jgi:hypothetical protein